MRDTIDINSNDNALFITSQCNNRCLMCCQPPLLRNDLDGYFQKNMALIDSAPRELRSIGITGGEPTLLGDRLFELLRHIRMKLPETEIHLLTNGRAFADKEYARKLAGCGTEKYFSAFRSIPIMRATMMLLRRSKALPRRRCSACITSDAMMSESNCG